MMQPPYPQRPPEAEMAGPFPPDLHDVRHLQLKAGLLLLWALVSFVATYFARDLQSLVVGGWPLGYWIAAQGAVVVFMGIVVAYCWAMNRFERQDAAARAAAAAPDAADADVDAAAGEFRAAGDEAPRSHG